MKNLKRAFSLLTTVLLFSMNNQTPFIVNKLLESNKFDTYMLLNKGVKSYSFTYKTRSFGEISESLKGEQFLLVDFENFEIRNRVPHLPMIKISYFENALS